MVEVAMEEVTGVMATEVDWAEGETEAGWEVLTAELEVGATEPRKHAMQ